MMRFFKPDNMSQSSSHLPAPAGGDFILYQTEDGRTRIQCRFENKTVWLTQSPDGGAFSDNDP
jgi:hypothetical protein